MDEVQFQKQQVLALTSKTLWVCLLSFQNDLSSADNKTTAIIKHCDLKEITVVGHSLGCLVALTLAANHSSLVSKLVLFGPIKSPPQRGKDGAKARASATRIGGMAKIADTVIGNAFAANSLQSRTEIVGFAREMLCRQDPEGYALACESLANSRDPEWSAIKAKTTIVSGSEDRVATPAVCAAIEQNLTDAEVELVTLEGVGHWHMLEDLGRCKAVLIKGVEG
jgi:3-oxoadipate enol-lactonase